MKKKMQKTLSILTLMMLIISQSHSVNASNTFRDIDPDRNSPDAIIAPQATRNRTVIYEYDCLKQVLSEKKINKILLEKVKKESLNKKSLGLNKIMLTQEIDEKIIASLTPNQKRASFSQCVLEHGINFHAYLPSQNKTVAYIDFSWEWSSEPNWRLTDIVGFGWQSDTVMTLVSDSLSTKHLIKYYRGVSETYKSSEQHGFTQYQGSCISDNITMQIDGSFSEEYSYAKKGSGEFKLTTAGECRNLAVSFKYGHQMIGFGNPYIAYPFGISFELKSVSSTVEDEIASSHLN